MRERIIGQKDQIQELFRIAKVWKDPVRYESTYRQRMPHIILLVGAAGTGKTTIAERFSLEAYKTLTYPDENEYRSDFQGWVQHTVLNAMRSEGGAGMRSIALFENLDIRLQGATSQTGTSPAEIFAAEMFVPKTSGLVFVTARSEEPLRTLIEQGVFDKIIRLKMPTVRENVSIFEDYLEEKGLKEIDCTLIASLLHNRTVADLERSLQIASEISFAAGRARISTNDLVEACLILAYDAHEITEKDKVRLTASAYHEAGHAIVEELLRPGSVAVASIKTYHSRIAGVTCETYPDERWDRDLDQRINIRVMLAGKAAVEAKYNVLDVGATFDVKMAKIAENRRIKKYECYSFADLYSRAKDIGGTGTLSDDFDRKTRTILSKEYSEILRFFSYESVKRCLDALSQALISKGTLLGSEIRAIMEENPIDNSCIEMFKMDE